MTPYRHKTFLANQQHLEARAVSITGQHGEIGRRERALFFEYKKVPVRELSEIQYEEYARREMMSYVPPFMKRPLHDFVRETVEKAYHQADRYGLTGLARMDFFLLYELTRRKGSAVHAWQTRLLVAPFLNPNFIRAVFGYADRTHTNAFHRYIIAANSPDWADVPYFEELEEKKLAQEGAGSEAQLQQRAETPSSWKQPQGRYNFSSSLYWQDVGKPLIDEALARGGFWTEVFDPGQAAAHWELAPDELAVLYLLPQVLSLPPAL